MVKIGSFHIGREDTETIPQIALGEAHVLRDFLERRYLCLATTQLNLQLAHDAEFKVFITDAINSVLKPQIARLEKELNRYQLPLPTRPPDSTNVNDALGSITDEYLFGMIFQGCQEFLHRAASAMSSMVHSDPLRNMFSTFFKQEFEAFDDLCKYGKVKGWVKPPIVLGGTR